MACKDLATYHIQATEARRDFFEFAGTKVSMRLQRTVLIIAVMVIVHLTGCRKEDEMKPTKLMPPLYSGYSLERVQRELELKPGDWAIREDRRPLTSDTRPPFRILTISHEGFVEYGVTGELVMTFYNDRLMTTLFYPANLGAVKASLAHQADLNFTPEGDARIQPTTRVWIGKDTQGRSYIGWIDLALEREQDQWIEKYEK